MQASLCLARYISILIMPIKVESTYVNSGFVMDEMNAWPVSMNHTVYVKL